MKARSDLVIWLNRLMTAKNGDQAADAQSQLKQASERYLNDLENSGEVIIRSEVQDGMLPPGGPFPVSSLSDADLGKLNTLLPWAAMTVDDQGRHIGSAWSSHKRATVNHLVERRHVAFNDAFPLAGKHVLEVGCFEGIHTISLLALGATVTGVDSRIENLLKTNTRLWCYGFEADVKKWDLEEATPANIPAKWDVLHHIGVLYHLSDPVGHLNDVLARTGDALLLDTHIARGADETNGQYEVGDRAYRYYHYGEDSSSPFAGERDHAKWLLLDDLQDVIRAQGFGDIRVVSDRAERNGRRITLWAFR
jgi:2-polyprenyl-3-methyl-5-hydroxy-6-metoxy-1,4-benzoquinol methylase